MKPEAQRIAIAKACGKVVAIDPHHGNRTCAVKNYDTVNGAIWIEAPDYLNDLNAMHEAEKVLTITLPPLPFKNSERTRYVYCLEEMNGSKGMCMATAAQRAEAFLRTLNLWTDDDKSTTP